MENAMYCTIMQRIGGMLRGCLVGLCSTKMCEYGFFHSIYLVQNAPFTSMWMHEMHYIWMKFHVFVQILHIHS
jgi:hypothetical protein